MPATKVAIIDIVDRFIVTSIKGVAVWRKKSKITPMLVARTVVAAGQTCPRLVLTFAFSRAASRASGWAALLALSSKIDDVCTIVRSSCVVVPNDFFGEPKISYGI